MQGLIFEIFEAWVIEQYGLDTWHTIKEVADCNVKDHSFVSRGNYQFSTLLDLIVATSEMINIRQSMVFKLFGRFSVGHMFGSEYGSLLRCQGSTLREWLSHVNAMQDHFQKSFHCEKFPPPVFWCEDSEEDKRCIMVHYFSHRGNIFVPMVHGMVEELAKTQFEVDINMDLVAMQNENDSRFTSWKISAIDEGLACKLKPSKEAVQRAIPDSFKNLNIPIKGPVSGSQSRVIRLNRAQSSRFLTEGKQLRSRSPPSSSATEGISMDLMRDVFPFHVTVDKEFRILQVGRSLPKVLQAKEEALHGVHIQDIFTITRPAFAFSWDWQSMNRLSHQNFFLTPQAESSNNAKQNKTTIDFKGAMLALSNDKVLFALCPHVENLQQLTEVGLSLSDLSLVTSQRDAVFLGEYVSKESKKTNSLDKLSKKLQSEQKLSNTLLYNMLPRQVADGLRVGETVEPRYYDDVTLFFSDIVGFTSLCQQVQPWEVIDLMNQLYSVMDALADQFNLYKVETVGDSYMCASGVPVADDSHGENIANFALAVVECTKHVKSPVTGEPIEMRIGIHTGSCTAGVVGTLTPRYALFGDMVNVASRHESTGMAGRIQCSHELFELLQSGKANSHYEFLERGFIDLKGKGEHLTFWLECGTVANKLACPSALESLSKKMENVLISEQWKMQQYFDKDESTHQDVEDDSLIPVKVVKNRVNAGSQTNETESEPVDISEWNTLLLDNSISREELQDKIFDVLFSTLKRCVGKDVNGLSDARKDLLHFIDLICGLYTHENVFQNVANVLMRAEFLLRLRKKCAGYDPWDHFVLLFSAFIRDVDLDGEEDSRLASRTGASSVGEGMSMEAAIEFLEDDYEDLCEVIFRGCPRFRKLMRKLAVASAELESEANFRTMLMEFDRTMAATSTSKKAVRRKNEVQLGMILILSTCGHYCQSYEVFLHWNQLQFKAELQAHKDGISDDPQHEWHEWQAAVFKSSVYHLLDRTDRFLTDSVRLRQRANLNEKQWRLEGREWVGAILVPYARVEATLNEDYSYEQHINANIEILEHFLRRVIASHRRNEDEADASESSEYMEAKTPYEELQLVIEMPPEANSKRIANFELPRVVKQELRAFVMSIAGGYKENEFHSFRHASHVVLLSNLLIESIDVAAQGKDGVTSDPLVCFAIVLSALVHDVGHTGVPNGQVAEENPELADRYNNQSIAEQYSIDVAWTSLMSKSLKHLRMCIFGSSESEKRRFRQLLVNNVMATDIFDKDLRALRHQRWEKAATCDHAKKTLAMEHIMQTSDVAHTMQEWDIYREWNERLFLEMYEAFSEGRAEYDPLDGWYNGELWFFDNWVIPLAQNLKACGVLSIVSDELVARARNNKRRWALEGEKICRSLWQKARERQMPPMMPRSNSKSSILSRRSSMHSEESTAVETMLVATVVEEIESLSKVMKRYEEKIETACTNLFGLTYKNENGAPAKQLKGQSWKKLLKHFRQQHWYRNLHDGTLREDDDDDELHIQHAPEPEEKKETIEDAIHEAEDDDDMSCLTESSAILNPRSHSTIVGEVY